MASVVTFCQLASLKSKRFAIGMRGSRVDLVNWVSRNIGSLSVLSLTMAHVDCCSTKRRKVLGVLDFIGVVWSEVGEASDRGRLSRLGRSRGSWRYWNLAEER